MKKKKSWVSIRPEMFRAGNIEFHTNTRTLVKNIRAAGTSCKRDYFDHCAGACRYSTLQEHSVLYIYVGDGKLDTLVHECFHAAVRYLAWVGVPLVHNSSNEAYAYFLEYLVREFKPILEGQTVAV